jgi:hypothetical protein
MNGDCLNPNLPNPHPLPITYILYNTNKGTGALGNQGTPKSQNCPRIQKLMLI